jgi:hypothetical protein
MCFISIGNFAQIEHRGEKSLRTVGIGAADPWEDVVVGLFRILAGEQLGHDAADQRGGAHVDTGFGPPRMRLGQRRLLYQPATCGT